MGKTEMVMKPYRSLVRSNEVNHCKCQSEDLKINIYKRTNVMQLGSMFISNCNNAVHVSDAFCVHPQEHLKTVVAASGV